VKLPVFVTNFLRAEAQDPEQNIREQNLRVIALAFIPLAFLAFVTQVLETVFTNQFYIGVPISGGAVGLLFFIIMLIKVHRVAAAQWLLVASILIAVVATAFATPITEPYSILVIMVAVVLSAMLLPRWTILTVFFAYYAVLTGLWWFRPDSTTVITTKVESILLPLFAYGSICFPLAILILYFRILFDRQIRKLQAANKETREALEIAREANAAKSRFLAAMSHELRTPLNAISGNVDLIAYGFYDGGTPAAGPQLELLDTVGRNAHKLLALINDLLDIARIESGQSRVNANTFALHALVNDVAQMHSLTAQRKGIQLSVSFDPKVRAMVCSDEDKLHKIISNLIGNGLKFTEKGTVRVEIFPANDAQHWRLIVADTGIGIPAQSLNSVFERFYQVDSSNTRKYQGSGLGLAIVKESVELLHGSIRVESQEATGTTFTVELPYIYPPEVAK